MGSPQVAIIMRNLMNRLEYKRYYVEGGDWGGIIGTAMITLFPEEVLGYHTNTALVMTTNAVLWELIGSMWPWSSEPDDGIVRVYPLVKIFWYLLQESGYGHIQATKPDSIGVALTDSPAGLLAYVLEKFAGWTRSEFISRRDGGLGKFTREQLIDNLMMYWTSPSVTTSLRLYAENFNIRTMGLRLEEIPTPVPTWVIIGKYEIANSPPNVLKAKYPNLINVSYADDGGHFFAFELPEIFAEDVLKAMTAFRKLRKNAKTDL